MLIASCLVFTLILMVFGITGTEYTASRRKYYIIKSFFMPDMPLVTKKQPLLTNCKPLVTFCVYMLSSFLLLCYAKAEKR
jgi:hypothetical protein